MLHLFTEDIRRNPYPLYQQMRSQSPVLYDPQSDLWALFDYDSVKRSLTDSENFSSSVTPATGNAPDWLVFSDPPRHTHLRRIIMQAFTPGSISNLEPRIRAISQELLNERQSPGEMDLVRDYAVPLPTMVIAELIGVPLENRPRFMRWSQAILGLSHAVMGNQAAAGALQDHANAKDEMRDYLEELSHARREVPRDDLLSRLVHAEVDGVKLSLDEILGFFQLLLAAGTETTANVISNAILSFIAHPDQLALLQADSARLPIAIEELVRYRSPGQIMFRETRHAVELQGQRIPAGKFVLAVIGSANHDSQHFQNPERLDILRDPNPHIAFGHGIHFCLGASLARLELRIALADLLENLVDFRLCSQEPWEPRQALHMHGPARLPIRFGSGQASLQV